MYCTKCGSELLDGDRFCAKCGAEVRQVVHQKYSNVVFNPPFKVEAQRRTEEILGFSEEPKPEVKQEAPKRESVSFNWEMDDVPAARPKKKTQDVDFNWGEVLEQKKQDSHRVVLEKIDFSDESRIDSIRVKLGRTQEYNLEETQKTLDAQLKKEQEVVGVAQPAKTISVTVEEDIPVMDLSELFPEMKKEEPAAEVSAAKPEMGKTAVFNADSLKRPSADNSRTAVYSGLDEMLKDAGLADEKPTAMFAGAALVAEKEVQEPEISEDVLNEKIEASEVEQLAKETAEPEAVEAAAPEEEMTAAEPAETEEAVPEITEVKAEETAVIETAEKAPAVAEKVEFDWKTDEEKAAEAALAAARRQEQEEEFGFVKHEEKAEISEDVLDEKIEASEVEQLAKEAAVSEVVETAAPEEEMTATAEPTEEPVSETSEAEAEEEQTAESGAEAEEDVLSIEELEKEIFALEKVLDETDENDPSRKEKFYTYNQKRGAFDRLLALEKAKLDGLEESYSKDKENLDYTWVSEVLPEIARENEAKKKGEVYVKKNEDKVSEKKIAQIKKEQAGKMAASRDTIIATPAMKKEINDAEKAAASEKGKGAARADVRKPVPDGSRKLKTDQRPPAPERTDIKEYFDAVEEENNKKNHPFAKFIIALLVLLLIIEGGLFAIKLLAPESSVSQWVNDALVKVVDKISGRETPSQPETPAVEEPEEPEVEEPIVSGNDSMMAGFVKSASNGVRTIGEVSFDPDLYYGAFIPVFDEVPEAADFQDKEWHTDDKGEDVTYGEALTKALVEYFDGWQESNEDENLVGINKLEIGEYRIGEKGFYSLCRITYAMADGSAQEQVATVYTEINDSAMVVQSVEEEINY